MAFERSGTTVCPDKWQDWKGVRHIIGIHDTDEKQNNRDRAKSPIGRYEKILLACTEYTISSFRCFGLVSRLDHDTANRIGQINN